MKPSLEMLLEYLKSVKDRNFSVEFEMGKLGIGEGDVGKNMNPYWELLLEHFEQVMVHGEDEGFKVDMLMKLARVCDSVPEEILCRTVPIIIKVVDGVGGGSCSSSWSVREASVCCLRRVACVGDGRMANEMGKFGVVHSLLRLLPESEGGFRRVLLRCLWCVVTFGADNRKIVAMNGGLEIVIGMLNSINDDGTRRYLLEILSALALIREVRRALDGSEALIFLVEACLFGSMVSRERACQALGLLGTTRCLRQRLVELGVIPVLVELFRIGDATMKLVAGNSLGVILADVGNNWPVTEVEVVHMYIELLQGPDSVGREIAEDVFCVLVYGEHNAVLIADYLVGVLREGNDE